MAPRTAARLAARSGCARGLRRAERPGGRDPIRGHISVQVVDDGPAEHSPRIEHGGWLRTAAGDKSEKAKLVGGLVAERARAAESPAWSSTGPGTSTTTDRCAGRRGPRGRPGILGEHDDEHMDPGAGTSNVGKVRGMSGTSAAVAASVGSSGATIRRGPAPEKSNYIERVGRDQRMAKVVKGGRRFSFTALVVVGDGDGTCCVGYGKAKEVPAGDPQGRRGGARSTSSRCQDPRHHPHPVQGGRRPRGPCSACLTRYGCDRRGSARAVLECAGVRDVLSKSLGSSNAINVVHARWRRCRDSSSRRRGEASWQSVRTSPRPRCCGPRAVPS